MRSKLVVGLALVVAVALGYGVAMAAPGFVDSKLRPPRPVEGAHTEAALPADNTGARLVAHVNGEASGFQLKRQEGVQTVTNPTAGRFCIRPTVAAGLVVNKIVPSVSTDYYATLGFDAFAQWNSARHGCPVGTITINTFDAGTGMPQNDVAFTVVVT
jgi:hypothetical protein